MAYTYRITVGRPEGDHPPAAGEALVFKATNHDDLFIILSAMRDKQMLRWEETAEFTIGFGRFADILMRHREMLRRNSGAAGAIEDYGMKTTCGGRPSG